MSDLILNNKENITSLELVKQINIFRQQEGNRAELQHYDLLKIIRNEFEEEITNGKISVSEYKDKTGRKLPMFELTYSQAKQVLMRESKFVRKAMIQYIEKLENKLSNNLPRTFAEALKLAYEQQLHIEKLEIENKQKEQIITEQQPKVSYYDLVLNSKNTVTITQIAKDYGISAIELNKKLHNLGIQYKQSNQWLLYSKYSSMGYTKSETFVDNKGNSRLNTKWTQKGRLFLYDLLKKENILPIIEQEGV